MPSPFGHSIAGLAVAWAADLVPGDRAWRAAPASAAWYRRAGNGLSVACALLAMAPDLDLGFTRHRTYTHSIGAVIAVGVVTFAVAAASSRAWLAGAPKARRWPARAARIGTMCAAAYASHMALDWLGVDLYPPPGLQVLWPFDSSWYISGLDLFRQTRREHLFTWPVFSENLLAMAQELAILGPIVVTLWLVRVKALARFAPEQSRRDHPAQ
jgi:LexA-binding, inner membrane-associated putative hydrolase